MAAAMINATVARALYETQLETLENFKKYLVAKDDVDMEFMEELIGGFRNTLQAPKIVGGKNSKKTSGDVNADGEKKKRAPSAYTLYIKHKMYLLKTEDPEIKSGKDLMSKAVEAWGGLTEEQKTALKTTLKEDATLSAEDLYAKVLSA